MSERVLVGAVSDFGHGDREIVTANGTNVGVFCLDGEFYAYENVCPHQGGPVCSGRVGGEIVAEFTEPGERIEETVSDTQVVACPWHGWEYDIESGQHLGVDDISLNEFDIVVDDGNVYVDV